MIHQTEPCSDVFGVGNSLVKWPAGLTSVDAYTSRYDALVAHIDQKTKCVDDVLLWSDTLEEAFHQTTEWLDLCGRNGIPPSSGLHRAPSTSLDL